MIYSTDSAGVYGVKSDMSVSSDITIAYKVGGVRTEKTFPHSFLPKELTDEYAKVTNKIARYVDSATHEIIEHDND